MTPAEELRASTWLPEIIPALLGGAQPRREGADVLRWEGHGGLTVKIKTGFWRLWSAARSHWSAVPLIQTLGSLTRAEALAWATAWLASHTGVGSCGTGGDYIEDEVDIERAEFCRELIGRMVPLADTPGQLYLASRGIWRDTLPDSLGYIADVRVGEGAFAAMLSFRGRIVGLQLTHIDPDGRKSTIPPVRRRYMLEKAAGAAFHLARPAGIYTTTNIIVAEGVEDALSVASLGRAAEVIGVPGVGVLQHLEVSKGSVITVVRDGDAEGSAPDQSLVKGLDHLLLSGAVVSITETPAGEDANSILLSAGPEILGALLDTAVPATLSPEGEIERLSRLSDLDYEQVRKAEADRLGIRVSVLDKSVGAKRARARPAADDTTDDGLPGRPIEYPVIELWPEPVEGAALLTAIAEAVNGYVRVEASAANATALYVVFSHCFEVFEHCPKIILKSAQKRSGKTRKLQVLRQLVGRPLHITGAEPAALLRIIARDLPTLLLDEMDTLMKGGGAEMAAALQNILNSGFDRTDGRPKNVSLPGGGWDPRLFGTMCPQVLAGIGSLPDTVTDRSVVIDMKRKKPGDTVKRLRARDGDDLRELARKAARWANDHLITLGDADPAPPPAD